MDSDHITTLASEALRLSQLALREQLPHFGAALAVPKNCWTDDASGTDGVDFWWNPGEVCRLFAEDSRRLMRVQLHFVLHGLYLHAFREPVGERRLWALACDIATEYRIDRMAVPGFTRPIPAVRSRCYRELREAQLPIREQEVAGWLATQKEERLPELEQAFRRDDHTRWVSREADDEENPVHREIGAPEEFQRKMTAVHRWRTVFESLPQSEREHRRQAGGSGGGQTQAIVLEERKSYDYRRFLKRFAQDGEERSLDLDSFDYIPYDYSRSMYERLVFLEPLEYREVRRLREFVIAIDTSGSCSGETVRRFLEETWEILREKENFFEEMNVHIIQCDCLVQDHARITSEKEWRDYLRKIEVKGHGDTDFTPVFRLVDSLVESGELKDLRGLLYFTDGDGVYPSEAPAYETAFVFLNQELKKGKTPDWAYDLCLE
ncbi:MAG: VWA-like domain-containing protein [Lachnospiraceae bacterium]|nr:VWA-like domain-containing protein [Lachnospiraceae bacterium]